MAFYLNALTKLIINKRPAQVTHTNDISIHFQTSRDSGVLFTTSKEANNDYIKAYVDNGHVHVDLFFERPGGQVRFTDCHRFSPEKKFFKKLFECQNPKKVDENSCSQITLSHGYVGTSRKLRE